MTKKDLEKIVARSKSKTDVCKTTWGYINGRTNRKLNELLDKYEIDISHFDGGADKHRLYEKILKVCPYAQKNFKHLKTKKKNKLVPIAAQILTSEAGLTILTGKNLLIEPHALGITRKNA